MDYGKFFNISMISVCSVVFYGIVLFCLLIKS